MTLKLVRKKKVTAAAPGRKKSSEIDKFLDAIDVQMRLASGEKVKKGRGFAKNWLADGEDYGVELVLVPRVGYKPLYAKSALVVDMKQKTPPTKELKELRRNVADGKLTNRIYSVARKKAKDKSA